MPSLTSDFLANQHARRRYKRFVLLAGVLLVIAAIVVTSLRLYDKQQAEKQKLLAKARASEGSCMLPDGWLKKHFGTADVTDPRVGGPEGDPDGDILTNCQEFFFAADPTNPVTSGSGQIDGVKVAVGMSPVSGEAFFSDAEMKKLSDQFLVSQNAEEFKTENIQKQVQELLNPPDINKIELRLEDPKALRVSSDNSPQAVAAYLQGVGEATADVDFDEQNLQGVLDDPSAFPGAVASGSVYDAIDRLRALPAPSNMLRFHQLHIASLFEVANLSAVASKIDHAADLEKQKPMIQEQYYHISVIQKIQAELDKELLALAPKYQSELDNYSQRQ